jgi:hypothetical protein
MNLITKRIRSGFTAAAVAVLLGLTAAPAAHAEQSTSSAAPLSAATATATSASGTSAEPEITIVRGPVSAGDVTPADYSTCGDIVCQNLVGSGLTLTEWNSTAWQKAGTTVCNVTVSFRWDVTTPTTRVWASGSTPGCYYTASGQTWSAYAKVPVTFPHATDVQVRWNSGWGNSPNAWVH